MAAAAFFDVLQQFGALPSDLVDMRKYCKWKAADILKAVKEGRKPDVGGPLSAEEKELNAMMAADAATLPDPEFASASSSSTTKLSPRLNSAPPATTAASNPTVHPPPKGNSAATTDDDLHLPSVPSSLTSSEVNIAPPDAPTSFDDDISSLLGNMPSVPKPSANKPPAASHQQPPTAPPPTVHLQPPPASSSSTTTTTAPAPPSYQSSVAANVAANTAEIRQMYESMLRAQSDQMLLLHQEQEKQMQELRALSERQAAQIAKLAAAPPASGASSSGGARKPAQHSFVTAAAAAAAAKQEDGAAAAVARMPEVHIPGAVSELLPVEKIDTELAFKHAKYIVSSLQYDDYTQAFKELKMVAKMLCGGDALMLNEAIPKK
jgi:vacuolar protein sorting-associated protein VTA1